MTSKDMSGKKIVPGLGDEFKSAVEHSGFVDKWVEGGHGQQVTLDREDPVSKATWPGMKKKK